MSISDRTLESFASPWIGGFGSLLGMGSLPLSTVNLIIAILSGIGGLVLIVVNLYCTIKRERRARERQDWARHDRGGKEIEHDVD